jgi:hypothetical protein
MRFPAMILACGVLTAAMAACSGGASAQSDARKLAATLRGEDKVGASRNPQCQLFTPADLSKIVGVPFEPGRDPLGGGISCQWRARSADGFVMVTVVDGKYYEAHTKAPGFKTISGSGIGTRAFVEHDNGWRAGALVGSEAVMAEVKGPGESEATAIALLKETIKRKAAK